MPSQNTPPPDYFDPDNVSSVTLYTDVGGRPDRPFMILATFAETSLGDLISKIAFVTSLKDQFDHARLFVRYNDFRPYSRDVVALSPNIDHAEAFSGETPRFLRKHWRDMRLWRPLSGAIKRSKRYREAFYDLVVLDSMANSRTVHIFEPATPLRVPQDRCAALEDQLVTLGLDRGKCFAVVHYRDGSYPLKSSNPVRNGNPDSYRQAIDHIIDNLGCQVVQIGHPEMIPFPQRSGLVDISRIENSFMLQAYAVSRARFMIGGASGPTSLGWSFATPTAVCDCAEAHSTWGSKHNICLTHEVTTPQGDKLQNQALYESGLLDIQEMTRRMRSGETYSLRKNSGEELCAVADHLHRNSAETTGWRAEAQAPAAKRPNRLSWPPQVSWNVKFTDA
jgi:putative glycosyltransferase (TIGR04372 family)